jgi:hypothetical protein
MTHQLTISEESRRLHLVEGRCDACKRVRRLILFDRNDKGQLVWLCLECVDEREPKSHLIGTKWLYGRPVHWVSPEQYERLKNSPEWAWAFPEKES